MIHVFMCLKTLKKLVMTMGGMFRKYGMYGR